jgi:predicted NBD/HSP70 family sugar kinase
MPMPIRNLVRAMNRATILELIRTSGMIPRIEIAKQTGLSQALLTGLTADLIKEGLIIEKKSGRSGGGRKPILLALNPDGAYVVGVNLAIGNISVVIANLEAEVLASHLMDLEPVNHSVEEIADKVVSSVRACIWEANFTKDQISGVGIGIPGPVDKKDGRIKFLPNYGWEDQDLKSLVEAKLNHPTFIENSSNTLALAEQWHGAGKGVDNFLVVTLENGVGMGGVLHGRLYRGHDGTAGEFGHLTVDPLGPLCRCGKRGCVEAFVGNISILREAKALAEQGEWSPPEPGRITYDHVLKGARKGNQALQNLFSRAGRMLGMGLAHLICLYSPAKIIFAGNGVRAGELLFEPMHQTLPDYLPNKFGQPGTEILVQRWSDQDWARGAGTLVLQELFKSPVISPGE